MRIPLIAFPLGVALFMIGVATSIPGDSNLIEGDVPWYTVALIYAGFGSVYWGGVALVWAALAGCRRAKVRRLRWPVVAAVAVGAVALTDSGEVGLLIGYVAGAHIVLVGLDLVTGRHLTQRAVRASQK